MPENTGLQLPPRWPGYRMISERIRQMGVFGLVQFTGLSLERRKRPPRIVQIIGRCHLMRCEAPPHTQTGLFVPELGKLFAAAQGQGDQSAEIRVYEAN